MEVCLLRKKGGAGCVPKVLGRVRGRYRKGWECLPSCGFCSNYSSKTRVKLKRADWGDFAYSLARNRLRSLGTTSEV